MSYSPEFLRTLPSIPVPKHVTRVQGCDCTGGMDMHESRCAIFRMPGDEALAAVEAAKERLREHTAQLNRELHAALGLPPDP